MCTCVSSSVMKICALFYLVVLAAVTRLGSSAAEVAHPEGVADRSQASVSIDSLISEALKNNPELGFYEAEISAAKGYRSGLEHLRNARVVSA